MQICVTGGCGYVGSVLVPKLLALGHKVRVVDLQWFGNHLATHPDLVVEKRDFRDITSLYKEDVVIHLAGIANDPQGELNPKLAWEVNALGTMKLAETAAKWGVKQFLYASSGSVYGVSLDPQVTEYSETNPISDYNKTKMVAERACWSYHDKMGVQILRPGTVCGFAPRMRLDVLVNSCVYQASEGKITIRGGDQMRPHIHIEDMCRAYIWLLNRPGLTGTFNAGFENISVANVARLVGGGIDVLDSNDPRSYRLNSDKLLNTGFRPRHSVSEAVEDLKKRFAEGSLKYDDRWINLKLTPALSS